MPPLAGELAKELENGKTGVKPYTILIKSLLRGVTTVMVHLEIKIAINNSKYFRELIGVKISFTIFSNLFRNLKPAFSTT